MSNNILETIEQLKIYTGETLAQTLNIAPLSNCSEKDISDTWQSILGRNSSLYESGWYTPPPHGLIVSFGKSGNKYKRICQPSFRPEHMWPSSLNRYDKEDIVSVYASPVERSLNLIGDFGLCLYAGQNNEIREHFKNVLQTCLHIIHHTQVGMSFKDLYEFGLSHGKAQGFLNNIESQSDKTGTNIGHTIPLSFKSDPTHARIKKAKSFDDVIEAIRTGRKFLNSAETQTIENNMAFTVEPRFATENLPNIWFHMTVIFENGNKRICHGFRPVFQKTGMNWLEKYLP